MSYRKYKKRSSGNETGFHVKFLNDAQKEAYQSYKKSSVLFLMGVAGCGKTHMAVNLAAQSLINNEADKLVITRPIVEAGESLGYLPGTFQEKVNPYMMPIYDCLDRMVGSNSATKDHILKKTEIIPLAFMRGRSLENRVCILDEAQNASFEQLKLMLTRIGQDSKLIITGDPNQSDIGHKSGLVDMVDKIYDVEGVEVVNFEKSAIVRHPIVGRILKRLDG